MIDMATSAVARGKIASYAGRGEELPPGWALDAAGQPTTDPAAALSGLLAPMGGAKGFALALLVEALAGGLAGPNLSAGVSDMFADADASVPQRLGHLLIALDPGCFDSGDGSARRRLDSLAESVTKAGGHQPGARRLLPGEVNPASPVEVPGQTAAELTAWADRLGVAVAAQDRAGQQPAG
jgi:(2R)-3-sulfolactate dehydrogenase (NADP+)